MTRSAIARFSIDINVLQGDDCNDVVKQALSDMFYHMGRMIMHHDDTVLDLAKLARLSVDLVYEQEGWNARFNLGISECKCND